MKKLALLFGFLISLNSVLQAQIFDPVVWDTSVKQVDANTYELIMTASIESGWHLYSQDGRIHSQARMD